MNNTANPGKDRNLIVFREAGGDCRRELDRMVEHTLSRYDYSDVVWRLQYGKVWAAIRRYEDAGITADESQPLAALYAKAAAMRDGRFGVTR